MAAWPVAWLGSTTIGKWVMARSAGMAAQELIREVDRQARNGDVPEQQTVEKARWIEGQIRMLYDLTAEPEQENVNASSSR